MHFSSLADADALGGAYVNVSRYTRITRDLSAADTVNKGFTRIMKMPTYSRNACQLVKLMLQQDSLELLFELF